MAKWLTALHYNRIECVGIAAMSSLINDGNWWGALGALAALIVANVLATLLAAQP